MGTYIDTSGIVDATGIEAADVKAPLDALDVELARRLKYARVYRTTDQVITTSTFPAIAFDAERYDNDTIHDNVTNNTRLTCKTAGKYRIGTCIAFAASAAGGREVLIQHNGATVICADGRAGVATINLVISIGTTYDLAVNDYLEVLVFQSSGGNLSVLSLGNYSPEFWMELVG